MNGNPLSGRVFKDVQSHGISAFHEYPQEKYDETIWNHRKKKTWKNNNYCWLTGGSRISEHINCRWKLKFRRPARHHWVWKASKPNWPLFSRSQVLLSFKPSAFAHLSQHIGKAGLKLGSAIGVPNFEPSTADQGFCWDPDIPRPWNHRIMVWSDHGMTWGGWGACDEVWSLCQVTLWYAVSIRSSPICHICKKKLEVAGTSVLRMLRAA